MMRQPLPTLERKATRFALLLALVLTVSTAAFGAEETSLPPGGPAREPNDDCFCSTEDAPLCFQGETYRNRCWALCALVEHGGFETIGDLTDALRAAPAGACDGAGTATARPEAERGDGEEAGHGAAVAERALAAAVARPSDGGAAGSSAARALGGGGGAAKAAIEAGYARVTSGTCSHHGMHNIATDEDCTAAAAELSITSATLDGVLKARPAGCFYSAAGWQITDDDNKELAFSAFPLCAIPASHDDHDAHASHPHHALFYLCVMLLLGTATLHILSRYVPSLPYTSVLLVEGALVAVLHQKTDKGLGTLSTSIDMWIEIDPHLLLYAFLPALLFGDSMGLNIHVSKKCFWQCLLLAGPGVVLGTGGIACIAKFCFDYNWDWSMCLLFGCISCATDPVAVVALLKELGASPKLTMLISGESMMNDGTAIVIFTVLIEIVKGETFTAGEITLQFVRMSIGGPIFGLVLGMLAIKWISKAALKAEEHDMMIQICITIAFAYTVFFVAENELKASGVLATVGAALVVATYAWPLFCDQETMHHVWHVIEYIGNTILFLLSGTIIGNTMASSFELRGKDYGYTILLWFLATFVRFGMIVVFAPILKNLGYGLSVKEMLVMTWGGLRGAVGLALAITVDRSIEGFDGTLVLFHVGGLALLTLIVNALTASHLLEGLGLTRLPMMQHLLLQNCKHRLIDHAKHTLEDVTKQVRQAHQNELDDDNLPEAKLARENNTERAAVQEAQVLEYVTILRCGQSEEDRKEVLYFESITKDDPQFPVAMSIIRRIFLRCVRAQYWHHITTGFLPETSRAVQALLNSTHTAMDIADKKLGDWGMLLDFMGKPGMAVDFLGWLDKKLPEWVTFDNYLQGLIMFSHEEDSYYMMACFIKAHKEAQKIVMEYIGEDGSADTAFEVQMLEESNDLIHQAKMRISTLSTEFMEMARAKQVASILLRKQRHYVIEVMEEGFLDHKEASHMLELIAHDMHEIARSDKRRGLVKGHARRQSVAGSGTLVDKKKEAKMRKKAKKSMTRAATKKKKAIGKKQHADMQARIEKIELEKKKNKANQVVPFKDPTPMDSTTTTNPMAVMPVSDGSMVVQDMSDDEQML